MDKFKNWGTGVGGAGGGQAALKSRFAHQASAAQILMSTPGNCYIASRHNQYMQYEPQHEKTSLQGF